MVNNCCLLEGIKNKIQYFGEQTNLHGVGHVLSKKVKWFKRLFWSVILLCTSYGAAWIFMKALSLFKSNVISYTAETTYLDWETPYPAVTICEHLDPDRINTYLHKHNMSLSMAPFYKEINFWNNKFCLTCSSCKINQTCLENIPQAVKDFRLKCQEILTDCWWNSKLFSCCDRFRPIQTEYGICYSFNSMLTGNSSNVQYLSQRTGLMYLEFSAKQPVMIRVHAPDETISVASDNILGKQSVLPLVSDFELILKVQQITSDTSINRLPQSTRGCLIWPEKPDAVKMWNLKQYSYSACTLHCRSVAQVDRCNCTHHLMPRLGIKTRGSPEYGLPYEWHSDASIIFYSFLPECSSSQNVPSCDIQGLICLNQIKDLNSVQCNCPMACEETFYKVVHIFNVRHKNPNSSLTIRGTRGIVRLSNLPTLRVRRRAIRDRLSIVVDVGGVGGVFFGASALSVIEIIYLLCIRRMP